MYQECRFGNNVTFEESQKNFRPNLSDYYAHPENYRLAPFRIFGNLYYVGDKKVCCHLIDTGAGLILFDTGYGHETDFLLENIRTLGFDPKDIRYIIHSHGHFDHFCGSNAIRAISGATVCMSAVDTQLLREMPERALMHWSPVPEAPICWPDRELADGEHIVLGNTDITCVLTPGHTFGTMTFFFHVTDGEKTYRAGYFGGVGFLTVYKLYCRQYGMPETKCACMAESIRKVWDEQVDILLGNHPAQNCTIEKRQWMLDNPGKNPFINPDAWHIFLTALEKRRKEFEELGY